MKLLLRTIFCLGLLVSCAATVYPCTCEIWKAEKKLRRAKAVFVGEVVEIGHNNKVPSLPVSIKLRVERYWKGIKEPFIVVLSPPGICCTCGLPVHVGEKYLIYAFRSDHESFETDTCTSAPVDSERSREELKILGNGKRLKR